MVAPRRGGLREADGVLGALLLGRSTAETTLWESLPGTGEEAVATRAHLAGAE